MAKKSTTPKAAKANTTTRTGRTRKPSHVLVPVGVIKAVRDNWESGDLAGAVNDLCDYIP